ncbi:gag-pol polyprotein [Lasallia pustulata]|uniref:Gag-pol polyprotein n=1 Tax=Lasallia pustulata TaxID=136370 RepID=A0A1W5CSH6_9LECA|nr:gag-pol polyprotein [Lasallia pustulata]
MGNILKFKARWVAHGYKQKEGLNFTNTFISVAKPISWKAMMGVSAKRGYKIWQMDIVTAYLFGFLDETVYIYQPTLMDDSTGRVCMLKKALYGLKQSARVWYQMLQDFLKKLGFKRVEADHGFFVSNDKSIFIAVYVDDILFFGAPNDKQI